MTDPYRWIDPWEEIKISYRTGLIQGYDAAEKAPQHPMEGQRDTEIVEWLRNRGYRVSHDR